MPSTEPSLVVPLVILGVLNLSSVIAMAVTLRLFRHVRRKQQAFLASFGNVSGIGNATVFHRRGRRYVGLYVLLTVSYAVGSFLILLFQPFA